MMMKRLICLVGLVLFCALVGKGWHWVKDGFSLSRTYEVLTKADGEDEGSCELKGAFRYLGRGHQCYAFESEDGKCVIKLPRYDRYRLSFFLRSSPFFTSHREEIRADIERRREFLHKSFELAFEELREETGLIYLHLHETNHLKTPLVIKDLLGRSYRLDPNRTAFILQEKKPIMMTAFQERLKRGDRRGAQEILDAFLKVLIVRSEKGIYNKDPSFMRNFGWDEGKGFQIDIGSFYRKSHVSLHEAREKSFQETATHVRNWLSQLDGEMLSAFDQKTEKIKESWAKE